VTERGAIALVTTSYPIAGDGSEAAGAFVADLVEALSEYVDVRVVAPGLSTEIQFRSQEIQVFRFKAPEAPLSNLKLWRPDQLISILRVLRSGQKALDLALDHSEVCHILALWALPSGHWAKQAGKRAGVPYSVWTLGSDIWSLGKIPVIRKYLAGILSEAEFCYSDGLQLAQDTEHLSKRPVNFLPSTRSITARRRKPARSKAPYRFVFIGRWHLNKGIDLLTEALHLLSADDWEKIESIRIFGGGPLRKSITSSVNNLRNAGRPCFLGGYITRAIAEEEITQADYLVIPSRIESIPIIFSDAMKLGCPVIATPAGDLGQLVKKFNVGILTEEINAMAIQDAISRSLEIRASSFAKNIICASDEFDLGKISKTLVENLTL
jgi:glycosyltransferase involved in cell wall biosynthesis